MSAYTDQYDGDFASDPNAGLFYSSYSLFKQALVAIWTEGALILGDSGSTDAQKALATAISNNPFGYARMLMPAFAGDATVRAAEATATDAEMQAAAHWIITILL